MTAPELKKNMDLLQLGPGRLMVQGSAPRQLVRDEKDTKDSTEIVLDKPEVDYCTPALGPSLAAELECMEVIIIVNRINSADSQNDGNEQDQESTENVLDDAR